MCRQRWSRQRQVHMVSGHGGKVGIGKCMQVTAGRGIGEQVV